MLHSSKEREQKKRKEKKREQKTRKEKKREQKTNSIDGLKGKTARLPVGSKGSIGPREKQIVLFDCIVILFFFKDLLLVRSKLCVHVIERND